MSCTGCLMFVEVLDVNSTRLAALMVVLNVDKIRNGQSTCISGVQVHDQ